MKKLFVDMDGVVADFVAGVCELFNKECPYTSHLERRGPEWWGIEDLLAIDKKAFWASLDEFFWTNLPETKEADIIMCLAEKHFHKSNICFLTSPCRTRGCYEGKLRWAEIHFPGIPVMFSSSVRDQDGITQSPKHMVAHSDALLIDDHNPNADSFVANGGSAFLFPRYWNTNHSAMSDWQRYLEGSLEFFAPTEHV